MQDSESAAVADLAGSIQEPEMTSSDAVQVAQPNDKTKFRLTLEPIMMLLLMGVNVSSECLVIFDPTCIFMNKSVCDQS